MTRTVRAKVGKSTLFRWVFTSASVAFSAAVESVLPRRVNMNKKMITVVAGLVLCALACPARAAGFSGSYTYKLVLRDDWGLALSGTGSESVSSNYKIEVYTSGGVKLNASVADASFGGERTVGHNCTVSVPVGDDSGYAKIGEQLTLVVTEKYSGSEKFRSSKVLPPVGGMFGIADAPVGAFWSDSADTDGGWDVWRLQVERTLAESTPISIGGPDEDYDGDGLSNLREYQFGTDPAGGALGLVNKPECSVVETDGVYKVSFNYGWGHVYSVRAIEGTEAIGRDGQDLALYESLESLNAGTAYGTYFYDSGYNTGRKEFYVKKPESATFVIGLAVDGRLLEYIQVGSASSLTVTPGFPIEYGTEEAAMAAKAIAVVAPSEAVQGVLTGEGAAEGYTAKFTAEVRQKDDKWVLAAELTPEAWTNLMDNATAAARQIPVAEIAALPMEATTNVVLTGCTPGFYYSLNSGTAVTDIAADAEAKNLGVLCGADGVVEFPAVKKPSAETGFFKVVTNLR